MAHPHTPPPDVTLDSLAAQLVELAARFSDLTHLIEQIAEDTCILRQDVNDLLAEDGFVDDPDDGTR